MLVAGLLEAYFTGKLNEFSQKVGEDEVRSASQFGTEWQVSLPNQRGVAMPVLLCTSSVTIPLM